MYLLVWLLINTLIIKIFKHKSQSAESATSKDWDFFYLKMLPHHFFKIEWIGFPNTRRKVAGCYLIGDCYVGASLHIRRRILSHLSSVYSVDKEDFVDDYLKLKSDKERYIYKCIATGEPVRVTYISDNVMDEKEMHIKYNIPILKYSNFYTHGKAHNKK